MNNKQASRTKTSTASSVRLVPEVGLVALADGSLPERLAGKVSDQLEVFAAQMRQGLLAASVTIGLDVMGELVDAEVTEVAGPKGRHDKDRAAYRHGSEAGKVTLGGRRVPVRRPRVRTVADAAGVEREVHLGAGARSRGRPSDDPGVRGCDRWRPAAGPPRQRAREAPRRPPRPEDQEHRCGA